MVEEPSPFVEEAQPDISRPRPEVEERSTPKSRSHLP